jgi:hypothetical protein
MQAEKFVQRQRLFSNLSDPLPDQTVSQGTRHARQPPLSIKHYCCNSIEHRDQWARFSRPATKEASHFTCQPRSCRELSEPSADSSFDSWKGNTESRTRT